MKPADLRQRPPYFDVVRMLLDHQLLDADYVECGKVDDVEIEIMDDGTLRAAAIFTGPGAAFEHLPGWMAAIARKLFGKRMKRIPWAEIALIESRVKLRSTSEALGLDAADRRAAAWVAKIPRGK
jgi:hypothetical protein